MEDYSNSFVAIVEKALKLDDEVLNYVEHKSIAGRLAIALPTLPDKVFYNGILDMEGYGYLSFADGIVLSRVKYDGSKIETGWSDCNVYTLDINGQLLNLRISENHVAIVDVKNSKYRNVKIF